MRRAKAAAAEAEARGEKPKTPEDFMHQQTHGARRPATFFMAAGGHSHKHGEDPASKEAAEKKKKKQQADDMDDTVSTDSTRDRARSKPRVKVRGHSRKHTRAINLADERDAKELEQFKEQARGVAFWHADATNSLLVKGMDTFQKKTNRGR